MKEVIKEIMSDAYEGIRLERHEKIADVEKYTSKPLQEIFGPIASVLDTTKTRVKFTTDCTRNWDGWYYSMGSFIYPNSIFLRTIEPRVFIHEITHAVQDLLGYTKAIKESLEKSVAMRVLEIQAFTSECLITGNQQSYRYAHKMLNRIQWATSEDEMMQYAGEIRNIVNFIQT